MNKPKAKNENIVVQELEKEILIYNLETNKAFCLNDTSSMIYRLCNGKRTISEISQSLNKKTKQTTNEDLIWLALDQFKRNGLLENNNKFEIDFGGLNRRQMIKKAGLASMIALPLISSIVAPNSVAAQSGLTNQPVFAACSSTSQCASGLNCSQCSFGNNCDGSNRCCHSVGFGRGAGSFITCAMSSSECSAAASQCCSGQTSFANDACWFGQSGTGNCFCV